MPALRPPGLGPIIGHTTHDSCRLWIQAADPEDTGGTFNSNRRTIGVIGLLSADRKTVVKGWYFRLQREYDRSGTFVLGKDVALGRYETDDVPPEQRDTPIKLEPDTLYCVRMGTLSLDDPMADDASLDDATLAERLPPIDVMAPLLMDLHADDCQVVLKTFPPSGVVQDRLTFLLGSCRYPGLLWKIKEADSIFGPMLDQFAPAGDAPPARFTLMIGDQIYADMLNRFIPLARADTYAEFQERYKAAFGSPNMRRILKTAPNYMVLDDHEIEDNWSQDRIDDIGKHQLFNLAIGAYMSYQWSHGPRTYGQLLYYKFDCAGYPFFVLDARTQRLKDSIHGLPANHMLGRPAIDPVHIGQLQRLLDWLSEQQRSHGNVPKFIGSSSVFAPNAMNERISDPTSAQALFTENRQHREASDSWPAYPNTRKAIVEHIVNNGIQNVVFVTGDIHCSNIARLYFCKGNDDAGLFGYDITSSAFYWPFPFADGDPNNYVHDSKAHDQIDGFPFDGGMMDYKSWAYTQEDNYCRIDLDRTRSIMVVSYYDRNGDQLAVTDAAGTLVKENVLPLAPWT